MSGIARLYTAPEIAEMPQWMPQCELDWRIMQAMPTTLQWVAQPSTRCCLCDDLLNSAAVYWVVLLPSDPKLGLGCSGGVCGRCGGLPRPQLQDYAESMAVLMFEPAAGNA